jgi:hypothetical protein
MGKWGVIGLCVIGIVLSACGERAAKKERRLKVRTSLIHPLFFQEEIASQLSFPFWFNDSLIRAQRIQTITWTIYRSTEVDEDSQPGSRRTQSDLKAKTIYTFDRSGRLTGLQRNDYSEGLTISSKSYAIVPTSSPVFSHVRQLQLSSLGTEEMTETYSFLKQVRSNERIQQYDDSYADARYHFFPDKKYWGALSVDSIGHPGGTDWIVHGTPERPVKRYQVHNTVTERNVTHYRYLNDNYPKMISWSDYPFTQKRWFTYSKNGGFVGYIDSTYIDQSFVTRNVTWLLYDKHNRPSAITHRKGHAASEANYQTIEKIRYTEFPSP